YIKEMTFPINFKHLSPLEECEKRIDEISTKFDDQISPTIIDDFNSTMIKTNQEFTLYNKSLIQNLIYNNYYASAIPLLNDHILRESNYINYQLETFKSLT
ncbi:MAG: DUF2935 domain-containing protein, partial [Bacilli bacterium]|nr:DUF2935 domain-containing protein [Bacilli bacterium]